jgi:hypothetical protein
MPTLAEERQPELVDDTDNEGAYPYLYARREYPDLQPNAGRTTTCRVGTTSPVSEYGPDD